MATPNRQICAQAMAHSTALTAIHIRRANSAPARPTESVTLRDSRHGNQRLAAVGHSLTASCMHTASDVFVILKAGRSARVARHERALPLIIDPCPDK